MPLNWRHCVAFPVLALITIAAATRLLGFKNRNSVQRLIRTGQLELVDGKLESEGLLERYGQIVNRSKAPPGDEGSTAGGRKTISRRINTVLDDGPVDYHEERGLHERAKRQMAEHELLVKMGELVYRKDFEAAQQAVLANLLLQASSLSHQIRTHIPHLTQQECEKIQELVDLVFSAVSSHSYEELDA